MTSTTISIPRGRKRNDVANGKGEVRAVRRFTCEKEGCGRSFTRAEHLQRHLLNHSTGDHTCARCRAHFKRKDLLERHMARHRQKDEEAGAEGCGVLNTRKRMWKDADGSIVTKKPALTEDVQPSQHLDHDSLGSLRDFVPFQDHEGGAPISPPISHDPSLGRSTFDDHDSGIAIGYPPTLSVNALSTSDGYSPPSDQHFWSSNLAQLEPFTPSTFEDAPFLDIFNSDTASSFNNPFTTMNNYNWLFDLDLSRQENPPASNLVSDPFQQFQFNAHMINPTSNGFELQLNQMTVGFNKTVSTAAQQGSVQSQLTDSPQQVSPGPIISPPITDDELRNVAKSALKDNSSYEQRKLPNVADTSKRREGIDPHSAVELERPLSMLQRSSSLPIVDELARAQLLDLIDVTQPVSPDGSVVTRDHPLLSLSSLQTHCDLFFIRFNTTYPLIHMSTFDPSHVNTLLLISVLLLGATYGEKDAHQLAVCIHDVLRPQIFANAGFSAKPDLWVLQTILLVECFGKSRAGQKQHDMSHLFHGLLINLIRRSDCQSVRPPTLEDSTEDLEDNWRTWVEAEQKKRLAFLCFMWDTQHAVLFCQSLCMSAFELRSSMPCDQSVWEADSAERWHQMRQKSSSSPLFLTCLKMYLSPSVASVPKNLNALSRTLLLHGLMSIAWDMQRRDQTSLGIIDTNPLRDWQARLSISYNAWSRDFDSFCAQYSSKLPCTAPFLAKEFQTFCTATLVLYHSAHILLHTPFLDLQIYAGARHILGRPVARADYVRSQRVVKKWVSENVREAGKAVWHAAALVESGMHILNANTSESGTRSGTGDLGGGRLWHLPWCMYLGTLVVWGAWYARPTPSTSDPSSLLPSHITYEEDDIIWDPHAEMLRLLEIIKRSEPEKLLEGSIAGPVGKKGTNGLAAVVSRCLSKVRWAVVHDGMMVLRGLVCWRLVGGGGMSGWLQGTL
ncbi:uncharacterized protein BDR25DRAFT_380184 [Lindgomyces ingoldianus]|uniref:Uncharacterized protein n=1 Tax=Lindgomyces ingoldianus TaxID=673940 RepID=A0ACB6QDY1_9PLEO|nr:uncharacterized protein BDR25DRAFT_380184 [Lindgomyces ingoldianus]KAF2465101.1 hypothetical protein BDR25DRAFT_380184 [Lindgomyces ingoldianus]